MRSEDQHTIKKLDVSEKLALIQPRELSSAVNVQLIRRCFLGLARFLDGFAILFFGLHSRIGIVLLFHALSRRLRIVFPVRSLVFLVFLITIGV
jgi:hypothetical protein